MLCIFKRFTDPEEVLRKQKIIFSVDVGWLNVVLGGFDLFDSTVVFHLFNFWLVEIDFTLIFIEYGLILF